MKKWLIALGMTICLLGLTACGAKEETVTYMSDSDAVSLGTQAVQLLSDVVSQGMEETYVAQVAYNGEDGQVYKSAFESWSKALPDIGNVLGIGNVTANTVELDILGMPKEGALDIEVLGSNHDAVVEVLFEYGEIAAITTNVNFSFSENMGKAGLNTLIGMGTVFTVLILISLIIYAFNLINVIQDKMAKKSVEQTPTAQAVDNTIAQIVAKEESDDLELVAVISAAIAAYEGTSTDGFVVRSIRKAR